MNHFDAVGFSECHSEEVISFFWRSVYDETRMIFNEMADVSLIIERLID